MSDIQNSKRNLRPKKNLGQNFLREVQVIQDLVTAAELTGKEVVLEPGAGTGVVTREIAKYARKVYAVEFDRDLIPELERGVPENVEVLNEDILQLDFSDLPVRSAGKQPPPSTILGSIPYQITSPLLHKILRWVSNKNQRADQRTLKIIILIQKEVAQKITAKPPKATYLSNLVGLFGKAEIVQTVPPEAFWPAPKVTSAILRLIINPSHNSPINQAANQLLKFEKFLHHGFRHPRKMLNKVFPLELLRQCEVDPKKRPGEITLEDWLYIYRTTSSQTKRDMLSNQ